jgi:hypothetical protein
MSSTTTYLYSEQSQHLDELFKAHAGFLGDVKNAPRKCKSHFGMYADLGGNLDTSRPALAKWGLSVMQTFMPFGTEGQVALVTTLGHSSGQFVRSVLPMRSSASMKPQEFAAFATYMRRVELSAILGMASEDEDDGETATKATDSAKVNDDKRIETLLTKKLRDSKTAEEGAAVLEKAMKGVREGKLSDGAYKRIEDAAAGMSWKQPQAA